MTNTPNPESYPVVWSAVRDEWPGLDPDHQRAIFDETVEYLATGRGGSSFTRAWCAANGFAPAVDPSPASPFVDAIHETSTDDLVELVRRDLASPVRGAGNDELVAIARRELACRELASSILVERDAYAEAIADLSSVSTNDDYRLMAVRNALIAYPDRDDPCGEYPTTLVDWAEPLVRTVFTVAEGRFWPEAREGLTSLLLELSLCPVHRRDYAICFDDENPECETVRAIHPVHDS